MVAPSLPPFLADSLPPTLQLSFGRLIAPTVGAFTLSIHIIETDMTADLPVKEVKKMIPLNKFGTVDDVAETVGFLCSGKQSYIHGQVIGVNGGLAI